MIDPEEDRQAFLNHYLPCTEKEAEAALAEAERHALEILRDRPFVDQQKKAIEMMGEANGQLLVIRDLTDLITKFGPTGRRDDLELRLALYVSSNMIRNPHPTTDWDHAHFRGKVLMYHAFINRLFGMRFPKQGVV